MKSYKDCLYELTDYMARVKQSSRLLIEQNIWDSISYDNLDVWLSNFKTSEEQLLSALMLDNLIYRSAGQTKALLLYALDSALTNAVYPTPWDVLHGDNYLEILSRRGSGNPIRLIPVIRDLDPPSKSGPSVARLYKRELNISDDYMSWPWLIGDMYRNGIRQFVFIDDVIASGEQFLEFLKKHIDSTLVDAEFYYIPLLAHETGIANVKKEFPQVKIHPVETVNDSDSFFNSKKNLEIKDLKQLYLDVEKKFVNKRLRGSVSLGYKELSLCFSYYHSTPNATLPLYWYEDDVFQPLVRR